MAVIATPIKPSSTNLQGGLAGIAAAMATGWLAKAGYLTLAASFIGVPEATLSLVAVGFIGQLANVAVTHIAELREADSFVKAIQDIQVEASYPKPQHYGDTH